jgi:hypothetical protein
MTSKSYKYLGPDFLTKAFSTNGYCSFKCSYPKDFNDPYELFLTIDFKQPPELLAYYQEVIGQLPQLPTTCFSRSPCIIPMWAHYAHNHRGVVVEIDEDRVQNHFAKISFEDVDYKDKADDDLLELLHRAYSIGKFRYHYLLQRGVFSAAYYTKHSCWRHEEERRIIASDDDVVQEQGVTLLKLPYECVSSLITGHKSTNKTKESVASLASKIEAEYYEMHIGRSTAQPYFVNSSKLTHVFDSKTISECVYVCDCCDEPTEYSMTCPWCAIKKNHQKQAANDNPLRMLHKIGVLKQYYKDMGDIDKK